MHDVVLSPPCDALGTFFVLLKVNSERSRGASIVKYP